MSLTAGGPAPTATIERIPPNIDVEKNRGEVTAASEGSDVQDDDQPEAFQQGVERVRAITEIWNRTTLVSMFVLSVSEVLFKASRINRYQIMAHTLRRHVSKLHRHGAQSLRYLFVR